ncbi:S1 family peptidase [Arthrobacter burdickii]|uniref:Trypsin-like serine protease n=1 Tax=Arthrobacter burdickii TaxID=3035920 RepID=A0ABT8JYY9_9MICC|nr:trypsin-like serine protease [Arthrobacter burdickii]MDN4609374.1 trypsin-like serine protease [Arthrobacter burdickii]
MRLLSRALAATAVLVLLAAGASPATAVTGGEPDADDHPGVALVFTYGGTGALQRCSATLISPTVLLTAAHCVSGTVGKSFVTFDPVIGNAPPVAIPHATDPAVGYTGADLAAAGALSGSSTAHPDYSGAAPVTDRADVGVIVLDAPAANIAPAELAPVGYLDQYRAPLLNRTIFEVVGYGTEVRKPDAGPQKPEPMNFPLLRRSTTSPGQKLGEQVLQLQGNPNDPRGGGGTCSGDSGGPVFLDGYLVAVSSYGFNTICRYIDGYQRTDIAVVQDWLALTTG